jgi:hypothetical protein
MPKNRSWLLLRSFVVCHLAVVLFVAVRDVRRAVAEKTEVAAPPHVSEANGDTPPLGSAIAIVNNAAVTFSHLAGIESGYGFFAPNVPAAHQLAFALERSDGRIETALLKGPTLESNLRISGLVDYIGKTHLESVRGLFVKQLALRLQRAHPDATAVQITVSRVRSPSARAYLAGERDSWVVLHTYQLDAEE